MTSCTIKHARSRTITVILCSIFCLLAPNSLQADFAGGTGELEDPYRIATAEQLISIGADTSLLDKCYILVADIDLDPNLPGGQVFTNAVIGHVDSGGFGGSFLGAGHVIRHLVIRAPAQDYIGLFGIIGTQEIYGRTVPGVVQNLHLEGVEISGHEHVGGLVGQNKGNILSCSVSGSVTGEEECAGGMAGSNQGTITLSHTDGEVAGDDYVGGLIGYNRAGTITLSYSASNVRGSEEIGGLAAASSGHIAGCHATRRVTGGRFAGGLVASNAGTIAQSYATNSVQSYEVTGGLVGSNSGPIVGCYATGRVTGGGNTDDTTASVCCGENTGGLVAINTGPISLSYATGCVSGSEYIGGLVGDNSGPIHSSYATGGVSGGQYVGGSVGSNRGIITECYSSGSVTDYAPSSEEVGGFTGYNAGDIIASFWDVETSGWVTSYGGVGLTRAEMQTAVPFVDAGWNFAAIWMICEGKDYPRLLWEQHECSD